MSEVYDRLHGQQVRVVRGVFAGQQGVVQGTYHDRVEVAWPTVSALGIPTVERMWMSADDVELLAEPELLKQ